MNIRLKKWVCILQAVSVITMLCACGQQNAPAAPAPEKEAATLDGSFVLHMPQDWTTEETGKEEYKIFSATDNKAGHADVYFYSNDAGDITLDDFLSDNRDYYDGSIIGDVKSTDSPFKGYYFEYSMEDTGEDDKQYSFRGYEYYYAVPDGIAELDLYYSQPKQGSKPYEVTDEEMSVLRGIAQGIEASRRAQISG